MDARRRELRRVMEEAFPRIPEGALTEAVREGEVDGWWAMEVYEELLGRKERNRKVAGAYYTPRNIVEQVVEGVLAEGATGQDGERFAFVREKLNGASRGKALNASSPLQQRRTQPWLWRAKLPLSVQERGPGGEASSHPHSRRHFAGPPPVLLPLEVGVRSDLDLVSRSVLIDTELSDTVPIGVGQGASQSVGRS